MLYQKPLEGSTPYAAHIINIDAFPLHRHYEAELIYCLEGGLSAEINGEAVSLAPGETVYVGSFVPHSYGAGKNTRIVLVEFGHELLREDFLSFTSLGDFYKAYPEAASVTAKMKEITVILENSDSFNRLDLIGKVYSLCGELLRDLKKGEPRKKCTDLERIAPALRLVQTNYTDNLTIDDACRETGLSPGNFCTLFKNAVGTGFHAYLNHKRTENAQLLLRQTELSVDEVASLSGFSDIKTFYRVFRRETGMSPLNFRKR